MERDPNESIDPVDRNTPGAMSCTSDSLALGLDSRISNGANPGGPHFLKVVQPDFVRGATICTSDGWMQDRSASSPSRPEITAMDPIGDALLRLLETLKLDNDPVWRSIADHRDLELRGIDFDTRDFEISNGSFEGKVRFLVSKSRQTIARSAGLDSRIYGGTVSGIIVSGEPEIVSVMIDHLSEGEIEVRALTGQADAAE